jgi:hypothetical protein
MPGTRRPRLAITLAATANRLDSPAGFSLYYPGQRQVSPSLAAFFDAIRVPAKGRKVR